MRFTTKTAAQRREEQVLFFRKELAQMETEGMLLLTEVQRRAVDAYHQRLLADFSRVFDVDRTPQAQQLSLGMRIISLLGALALAASVLFLVFQFWYRFDTAAQAAILIAAPIISFSVTMLIARWDSGGYFVKISATVTFACFVVNQYMLGRIFNIEWSDMSLLFWASFGFFLAYSLDMRLLLSAAIICLIGFASARTGTVGGMYWLDFDERPENFLPIGLLLFLFPAWVDHWRFSGFARIYRVFGLLSLLLPILVLANYGDLSYLSLNARGVERWYQVTGFVLSALAILVGVSRQWRETANTGNVFFVIFLFTKFFDWWWETLPKYLFFLIIGLSAVMLLFVFKRMRGRLNLVEEAYSS